jgi:hypothetical protein
MTKSELATQIETLRTAIGVNRGFLKLVPPGADKATERQVERDRLELERLQVELAKAEASEKQAEQDRHTLDLILDAARSGHAQTLYASEIEALERIHARLEGVAK